jgi:hypothetical protein
MEEVMNKILKVVANTTPLERTLLGALLVIFILAALNSLYGESIVRFIVS